MCLLRCWKWTVKLLKHILHWAIFFVDGVRVSSRTQGNFSAFGQNTTALDAINPADIESIEVMHQVAPLCDDRGNCEKERSRFVWRTADGEQRVGAVIDVHLAVR